MCGIVGFIGKHEVAQILLDGLLKLEYRGYDSAGIAVRDGLSFDEAVKSTGKLINLYKKQMVVTLLVNKKVRRVI